LQDAEFDRRSRVEETLDPLPRRQMRIRMDTLHGSRPAAVIGTLSRLQYLVYASLIQR
jgi:hypothetical protein